MPLPPRTVLSIRCTMGDCNRAVGIPFDKFVCFHDMSVLERLMGELWTGSGWVLRTGHHAKFTDAKFIMPVCDTCFELVDVELRDRVRAEMAKEYGKPGTRDLDA